MKSQGWWHTIPVQGWSKMQFGCRRKSKPPALADRSANIEPMGTIDRVFPFTLRSGTIPGNNNTARCVAGVNIRKNRGNKGSNRAATVDGWIFTDAGNDNTVR